MLSINTNLSSKKNITLLPRWEKVGVARMRVDIRLPLTRLSDTLSHKGRGNELGGALCCQ